MKLNSYYNKEGYADGTANSAMYYSKYSKRPTIKPLPKKDKVYDMTTPFDKTKQPWPRTWEIFLHYAGYHNPDLGIWVKVTAFTEEEAKTAALCQTITTKKVEVSAILRK